MVKQDDDAMVVNQTVNADGAADGLNRTVPVRGPAVREVVVVLPNRKIPSKFKEIQIELL